MFILSFTCTSSGIRVETFQCISDYVCMCYQARTTDFKQRFNMLEVVDPKSKTVTVFLTLSALFKTFYISPARRSSKSRDTGHEFSILQLRHLTHDSLNYPRREIRDMPGTRNVS